MWKVNNVALLIDILIKWVSNLITTETGNRNTFPCTQIIILLMILLPHRDKNGNQ